MNKTVRKPLPPAGPEEDEDPIWGDALADFFGLRSFSSLSAATPPDVQEDKPQAPKPARKRAGPRGRASLGKGSAGPA